MGNRQSQTCLAQTPTRTKTTPSGPLITKLNEAGFSVQLNHTEEETSWEDLDTHGYVLLKTAEDQEIVRKGGFQHNRNLRSGGAFDEAAVSELVEEVQRAVATAPKEA